MDTDDLERIAAVLGMDVFTMLRDVPRSVAVTVSGRLPTAEKSS